MARTKQPLTSASEVLLLRIAIVHHWFVTRGGGERVAECIAALFPQAELFTLVSSDSGLPRTLRHRTLHTSFVQRLPLGTTHHRHFLPLYPAATESLDLRGFDLVLSSDSGPVKGVRLDPGAVHICYCHSPMRYLWDGFEQYRSAMSGLTRLAFSATAPRLRTWDRSAAQRVTHFIANSSYVADRILRCYAREATVIHPPIDLHLAAKQGDVVPGDHYLCAGRLVSYKRTEILIEACRIAGRALRIMGVGPEVQKLRQLAGPHVTFLGDLDPTGWWAEYSRCRALLFAADEDFGMVPLEAQACGRPVIAYGAGGSLETVRGDAGQSARTGEYFLTQTAVAAANAIQQWEADGEKHFQPQDAKGWAASFATSLFLSRYRDFVLERAPQAASHTLSVAEAAAIVCQ
jgi:glycosyltransferase involved in cell wall biosynthesis